MKEGTQQNTLYYIVHCNESNYISSEPVSFWCCLRWPIWWVRVRCVPTYHAWLIDILIIVIVLRCYVVKLFIFFCCSFEFFCVRCVVLCWSMLLTPTCPLYVNGWQSYSSSKQVRCECMFENVKWKLNECHKWSPKAEKQRKIRERKIWSIFGTYHLSACRFSYSEDLYTSKIDHTNPYLYAIAMWFSLDCYWLEDIVDLFDVMQCNIPSF